MGSPGDLRPEHPRVILLSRTWCPDPGAWGSCPHFRVRTPRFTANARTDARDKEQDTMSLSVQAPPTGPAYDERASLHRLRWRFFALGLACLVVGLLAISFAFIATMTKVI